MTRLRQFLLAWFTVVVLTACQQPDPEIAMVIDDSGSSTSRNLPSAAYDALAEAIRRTTPEGTYPSGRITISHARGDSFADSACPQESVDLSFELQDNEYLDSAESTRKLSAAEDMLVDSIACAEKNPAKGSDLLGGVVVAAQALGGTGERIMVIVTDGRINAEPIHLRLDGMTESEMDEELRQALALPMPDLQGVGVFLVGVGADTASQDPQETLALRLWWEEYLDAAGASWVEFVAARTDQGAEASK